MNDLRRRRLASHLFRFVGIPLTAAMLLLIGRVPLAAQPPQAAQSAADELTVTKGPRAVPRVVSLREASAMAPVSDGDWASYNGGAQGWRLNPHETTLSADSIRQLELKWQFPAEDSDLKIGVVHVTPSVVDGYVYFGTATRPMFYCVSPEGELVWEYEVRDLRNPGFNKVNHGTRLRPQTGVYTSALVTDDSVYFGNGAGVIFCLDRATGAEKWFINTRFPPFPGAHQANLVMGSPILADGKVVFGGGAYEHGVPLIPGYECCSGRGFVVAMEPETGEVLWKYDVGPEPEKFDPPMVVENEYGRRVYHFGPSTSSVWCTPSWDEESNTVFFGTDVHNSPRRPTEDDPRDYTEHSAAVIAVRGDDGSERWVRQLSAGDVWNFTIPSYNRKTGQYKDQSIGDTPKVYSIEVDGASVPVVGCGCKNGGYYVIHRDTGELLANTPIYTGPPVRNPTVDPRTLALPSPIGGIQTGCATDGVRVFTNGIDMLPYRPLPGEVRKAPTGGRVTAISLDTQEEFWRHNRPKIPWIGGTQDKPLFRNCGDPIASGIAVANGLAFCTTFSSNQLLCLNAVTGELLKEIPLGPVLCGPSVSRGQVYVGTGNTQFNDNPTEAFFPKRYTGELLVFGLPDDGAGE